MVLIFNGSFNKFIDSLKNSFPNLISLHLNRDFNQLIDVLKDTNLKEFYIKTKNYKNINEYLFIV